MSNFDETQAICLYKSPKSVRKGLSLRDMFPARHERFQAGLVDEKHPIIVKVSLRPGFWQRITETFERFEQALELVDDFERRGYRVKIIDRTAA